MLSNCLIPIDYGYRGLYNGWYGILPTFRAAGADSDGRVCAQNTVSTACNRGIVGILLFIPATIGATIIRNQFTVQRTEALSYAVRLFMSDYLVQILFLVLCIMVLTRSKLRHIALPDNENGLLIFICGYFFGEALYRLLFIPVVANGYELFIFPNLRFALIFALRSAYRAVGEKRMVWAMSMVSALIVSSILVSTLIWYRFFIFGIITLTAIACGMLWLYIRPQHAA